MHVLVSGIRRVIEYRASSFEVINLGNDETVSLLDMIQGLQLALGRAAELQWLPPTTTYLDGARRFADWLSSARQLTPQ
jgi:nucleoside-diphosphate-sugar epimerase